MHSIDFSPRRRARWMMAAALLLVPALARPAAAQHDRGASGLFRDGATETRTELGVPAPLAWRAVSEVLAEMGFTLSGASNTRGMEYLTNFMELRGRLFNRPNSDFFSCQNGDLVNDLTNTGQITFAIRSRVARSGEGSALITQIDARARRRGANTGSVDCVTTANLEKGLAQLVQARMTQLSRPDSAAALAPSP